jgi:hypothetical protein
MANAPTVRCSSVARTKIDGQSGLSQTMVNPVTVMFVETYPYNQPIVVKPTDS